MFDGDSGLQNSVRNLGGSPPLRNLAAQKHQNLGAISDNFATWSRISPECNIVNRKTALQTTDIQSHSNLIRCTLDHKRRKIGPEFWSSKQSAITLSIAMHLFFLACALTLLCFLLLVTGLNLFDRSSESFASCLTDIKSPNCIDLRLKSLAVRVKCWFRFLHIFNNNNNNNWYKKIIIYNNNNDNKIRRRTLKFLQRCRS